MSAKTAPTSLMTAASLGKMPTTRARRLISLLTRSSGLVDHTFGQWLRGNAVKASTSVLASSIRGPILGKAVASWSRTVSQVAATVAASGWAKIVRNTAATMSLCDLGTSAKQVPGKMHQAALMRSALQDPAQRRD